jgi:hypothetical protein
MKRGDWVVVGGKTGEIGHCTRCGDGLEMGLPQRVEVVMAAMNAFTKAHAACEPGGYVEPEPKSIHGWLQGRDTGTSSLTIYAAITGERSPARELDVPQDPSDFGRCYRLLKRFPEWRGQLYKTADLCKKWRPFVEDWDKLTALYEQELASDTAPKLLYARLRELRGGL